MDIYNPHRTEILEDGNQELFILFEEYGLDKGNTKRITGDNIYIGTNAEGMSYAVQVIKPVEDTRNLSFIESHQTRGLPKYIEGRTFSDGSIAIVYETLSNPVLIQEKITQGVFTHVDSFLLAYYLHLMEEDLKDEPMLAESPVLIKNPKEWAKNSSLSFQKRFNVNLDNFIQLLNDYVNVVNNSLPDVVKSLRPLIQRLKATADFYTSLGPILPMIAGTSGIEGRQISTIINPNVPAVANAAPTGRDVEGLNLTYAKKAYLRFYQTAGMIAYIVAWTGDLNTAKQVLEDRYSLLDPLSKVLFMQFFGAIFAQRFTGDMGDQLVEKREEIIQTRNINSIGNERDPLQVISDGENFLDELKKLGFRIAPRSQA